MADPKNPIDQLVSGDIAQNDKLESVFRNLFGASAFYDPGITLASEVLKIVSDPEIPAQSHIIRGCDKVNLAMSVGEEGLKHIVEQLLTNTPGDGSDRAFELLREMPEQLCPITAEKKFYIGQGRDEEFNRRMDMASVASELNGDIFMSLYRKNGQYSNLESAVKSYRGISLDVGGFEGSYEVKRTPHPLSGPAAERSEKKLDALYAELQGKSFSSVNEELAWGCSFAHRDKALALKTAQKAWTTAKQEVSADASSINAYPYRAFSALNEIGFDDSQCEPAVALYNEIVAAGYDKSLPTSFRHDIGSGLRMAVPSNWEGSMISYAAKLDEGDMSAAKFYRAEAKKSCPGDSAMAEFKAKDAMIQKGAKLRHQLGEQKPGFIRRIITKVTTTFKRILGRKTPELEN